MQEKILGSFVVGCAIFAAVCITYCAIVYGF